MWKAKGYFKKRAPKNKNGGEQRGGKLFNFFVTGYYFFLFKSFFSNKGGKRENPPPDRVFFLFFVNKLGPSQAGNNKKIIFLKKLFSQLNFYSFFAPRFFLRGPTN